MVRIYFKMLFYLALFLSFPTFASGQYVNYVPNEIIVKIKNTEPYGSVKGGVSQNDKAQQFVGKATSQKGLALKGSFSKMGIYHFAVKPGQRVEDTVADLERDPDVEYAEPNYIFNKATVGGLNQTFTTGEVQGMSGSSSYLATGAPIQVTSTWATVAHSSVPVVAVIDTGLDINHSVFSSTNAVWTNPNEIAGNGIDDDHNGYIDDVHGWNFVANNGTMIDDDGHGTHVSGIILGTTQDIYSPPLQQALIKIMPLKFLDGSGYGKTSDAIRAIYYAVNNGASILNNSWGGSAYSSALHEAIAYSYNAGVVFAAAAGNNGSSNDSSPIYPANYQVPNVVTVGATTDSDVFAYFSNYSPSKVHLAAPGVFILSTIPSNGFGSMSGTSMATPFVSGLAALMKIEKPTILPHQVREIIMAESDVIVDNLGSHTLATKVYSQGRMNAYNTVQATKTAAIETSQPAYTYTNSDRELASSIAAGGCGIVSKMISKGGGSGGEGPQSWSIFLFMVIMVVPIVIYNLLRRKTPEYRRQYERYKINSEVKVKIGDRELVASVSSISQGGVQINTDAMLDEGGIVGMVIRSPDGKEQISVEGRVVWSEAQKAYGVQFAQTTEGIKSRIAMWTRALARSS